MNEQSNDLRLAASQAARVLIWNVAQVFHYLQNSLTCLRINTVKVCRNARHGRVRYASSFGDIEDRYFTRLAITLTHKRPPMTALTYFGYAGGLSTSPGK